MAKLSEPSSQPEETKDSTASLLESARQRFKLAAEAEGDYRKEALDDQKFVIGEHWPEEAKRDRYADGRPCLTVNKIPQFIRQITNDQRQNRPAIKISPVDDNADVETAKILQGIIRHIEYNSGADVAYDTAFESAVIHGRGWFRILTKYLTELSFDQELIIEAVPNPFSVYPDPASVKPDGSDMQYLFIEEFLALEEYKERYPDSEISGVDATQTNGASAPDWMTGEKVRVVEYFYKEVKEEPIVLLKSGEVVKRADLPKDFPKDMIAKERVAEIPVIKWAKLNGVEILEEREWIGNYIPVVPVLGAQYFVDGKRVLEGIVRHAKDSARLYNMWVSTETETISLAPRAPFIGYEGQFTGHEAKWRTAHKKSHAYLEIKPTTIGGQPAPFPQRQVYEPPIQALTMAKGQASDDMKATTGIYDASLGARSNENSGVAIQRRNMQAQTSNFHFVDNLGRSIRQAGRILVDLIPKIYDTERAIRIIGEDGEEEIVKINAVLGDKTVDLSLGKYDAVCETGPSYATKRQEGLAVMMELLKSMPVVGQAAPDLITKNVDFPMAKEVSDRIRKMLPPGIADDKEQGEPLPPQVQAQLQQLSQQNEALTQQLNRVMDEREQKTLELESKERIEMKKLEVQLAIEAAKIDQAASASLFQAQLDEINQRQTFLRENAPINPDFEGAQAPQMPTAGPSAGSPMEGM